MLNKRQHVRRGVIAGAIGGGLMGCLVASGGTGLLSPMLAPFVGAYFSCGGPTIDWPIFALLAIGGDAALGGVIGAGIFSFKYVAPPGYCSKCGYDLTGNESGVCPECGTTITKN